MEYINWKNGLFISGPMLCGLAFKYIKNSIENKCEYSINEVLFYGATDEEKVKQIGLDNLFCINYAISQAKSTVDVCVPSLESETIAKSLINVHLKNKAKVRIAIHNSDQFRNLNTFAKHGIEVKVIRSAERIEHEFALIDASEGVNDALAVMGSLDYETTRVNCNRDSTILTTEPKVVMNLQKEFDRIWNSTPDVFREKEDKSNLNNTS